MKAYISTYNKENLDILIQNLKDKKYEIYSDDETKKYLKNKGIEVIEAKDEEIFDLVAINLFSFDEYLDKDIELETLINSIDIENLNILRTHAKNYKNAVVLSNPEDFKLDLDEIDENTKEKLALSAFLYSSKYDFLINKKLSQEFNQNQEDKAFYFNKIKDLKYGENPHQKASLYSYDKEIDWLLLSDSKLSYNNILDYSSAIEILAEFFDVSACVIIKHANPCAVALSDSINHAFDKAIDSDPISPIDGIVAFTKEIDGILARKLNSMTLNTVIAPSYEPRALEILKSNKNLKLIQINSNLQEVLKLVDEEIKLTPLGALIQEKDTKDLDVKTFKVVTEKKPEQREVEDMIFATKVAKHIKSHGVVVAKDLRTLGICASGTNNASTLEIALSKVCDSPKDSVVAYDGAFNSIDNIQIMAQNRVSATIQTGGDIKDKEIIDCANKLNMAMISTGIRHFRH